MMRRRKLSLILLAFMILMAGCSDHGNQQEQQSAPIVPVVKAACRNLGTNLEIASEFRPYQEVDVYAKVSGYVKDLYINWGTHVRKGQVLAILEIPELEEQLQRDKASVRRSEHEITRLQQELIRAQSAYTVAHLTYSRLAEVQKTQPNLIAQQEIDLAAGKDHEASANVSAATASLEAAREALLDTQAALKQDEALFAYSRITAPFDGVVTRLDAYTGALLPAATSSDKTATPLCHLSQNSQLRLVIPLPQNVLGEVRVGQIVTVKTATTGKSFKGSPSSLVKSSFKPVRCILR